MDKFDIINRKLQKQKRRRDILEWANTGDNFDRALEKVLAKMRSGELIFDVPIEPLLQHTNELEKN